jgi:hypothetical protein
MRCKKGDFFLIRMFDITLPRRLSHLNFEIFCAEGVKPYRLPFSKGKPILSAWMQARDTAAR